MQQATDLGVARRLSRIMDDAGHIRVVAIDHPEPYQLLFDTDLNRVTFEEVAESKLRLVRGMATCATGLILDPVTSLAPAIATGYLPGNVGLISGVEDFYFDPTISDLRSSLSVRQGWEPPKLASLGVDVVKLVVYSRHDDPARDVHLRFVQSVADQCHTLHLPIIVEPIWLHGPDEDPMDPAVRALRMESTIDSSDAFRSAGADVMKLEFPWQLLTEGDEALAHEACARITTATNGPWVILSAGVTFAEFASQLRIAAANGACGYMAGRAIWADAVGRIGQDSLERGTATAVRRLSELNEIMAAAPSSRERTSVSSALAAYGPRWFMHACDTDHVANGSSEPGSTLPSRPGSSPSRPRVRPPLPALLVRHGRTGRGWP